MRKIIAAINMTLDGFCDHTAVIADEELHQHYSALLRDAGTLIYGRITYRLMEDYWPTVAKAPTGDKAMDEFAQAIEAIPKVVFSNTLTVVDWKNVRLARRSLEEEVRTLRQQSGKDILVGSPGLIAALTKLELIDEYQLCIHPVIAGGGLPLFRNAGDRSTLKLTQTKAFDSGAIILYYVPSTNRLP